MKRCIIIIVLVNVVYNASADWSQKCPGTYPSSYFTGAQQSTLAPSPTVSCNLYAQDIVMPANSYLIAAYGTVEFDVNGNAGCIVTGLIEGGGEGQVGNNHLIGFNCLPEDAVSCAEFAGTSTAIASATTNSTECIGTCTATANSGDYVISTSSSGAAHYVQGYNFTGNTCGNTEPDPPFDNNDPPVYDLYDDPCVIQSQGSGRTITCMDQDTNCGTYSYNDGSSTNTVTGCLDSNPPPSGGCVAIGNSGDAACDGAETTSPPLPDSGTANNPANIAMQMVDQDGNVVNFYEQTQIENSTYTTYISDSGSDPLPGGDPGTTPVQVDVTVEIECTWWFCDEPLPIDEPVFTSSELDAGLNSLNAEIVAAPGQGGLTGGFATSSIIGWGSLTGGACFTLPFTYYGVSYVFDDHCDPWDTYVRPALAFFFFVITGMFVVNSFYSIIRITS